MASPLYVGSAATSTLAYNETGHPVDVTVGGFVEPQVFGCRVASAAENVVTAAEGLGDHGCGLRVQDAVGISSWFMGAYVDSFRHLPDLADARLGVERRYSAKGKDTDLALQREARDGQTTKEKRI